VERTIMAINSAGSEEDQKARAARALQDPEIQAILQDGTMRNVLSDMQSDPSSANKFLKDPTIKANIEKLIAAGVLSMK
jgi:stress-induced-phosphoprotein 1